MDNLVTAVFVDGENLLNRFEAMLKSGWTRRTKVAHSPQRFVWEGTMLRDFFYDQVIRVTYYTSYYGSDDAIFSLRSDIAAAPATLPSGTNPPSVSLVPAVFKKLRRDAKSKSVDINLTTDLLRGAYTDSFDRVLLVTGDGDYVPVIQDVMRQGKQVYVAALSQGLNKELPVVADRFMNLDQHFVLPPPPDGVKYMDP